MTPASFAFVFYSLLTFSAHGSDTLATHQIKVLLKKSAAPVEVGTTNGRLQWKTEDSGEWIALPSRVTVSPGRNGEQIHIGSHSTTSSTILLRASAGAEWTLDEKRRSGVLQITRKAGGLWFLVKTPLETYTAGVVLAEMGSRAEFEALKAQAVAARTFAYHRLKNPRNTTYDVESNVFDQVFGSTGKYSLVNDAVRATQGEYLFYSDSEKKKNLPPPFKAFFHSRCGGHTATAKEIWINSEGNRGQSAPCTYCQKNHYRWVAKIPWDEFSASLKIPLSSVEIKQYQTDTAGRIVALSVEASGFNKVLRTEELRQKLGFSLLQSSLFTWSAATSGIQFSGQGAGHGVGLCQWGARGMAREGKSYDQILQHYYSGSHLYKPSQRVSFLTNAK